MGIFGKKKKKNIEVLGKAEGERQKNLNEPKFKIVVFKTLGRDVPQQIDTFYATQKKDSSGSMFLVNDDHNFKESLAISKHPQIEKLKDKLELKKLTQHKKIEAIDKKLELTEDRVRNTVAGIYTDKDGKEHKINYIDEEKTLKELKVLKYMINKSDTGSFESIDGEGFRQRFYLYDEGALIPIFWDRKGVSLYPSTDTSIKFYKSDQDYINQDYADENRSKWANIGRGLMVVLFVILFIANMYVFMNNLDRSNELDARSTGMAKAIEDSNFGQCVATISTTNKELLEIINEYRVENGLNITNDLNKVNTDLS